MAGQECEANVCLSGLFPYVKGLHTIGPRKEKLTGSSGARPLNLEGNETEIRATKEAECFPTALPLWPVNPVENDM